MPEFHGAVGNLLLNVPQSQIDCVSQLIIQRSVNEYQDYFDYARNALGISLPNDWQEVVRLYRKLLTIAVNGALLLKLSLRSLEILLDISHFKQVMPCFLSQNYTNCQLVLTLLYSISAIESIIEG